MNKTDQAQSKPKREYKVHPDSVGRKSHLKINPTILKGAVSADDMRVDRSTAVHGQPQQENSK